MVTPQESVKEDPFAGPLRWAFYCLESESSRAIDRDQAEIVSKKGVVLVLMYTNLFELVTATAVIKMHMACHDFERFIQ